MDTLTTKPRNKETEGVKRDAGACGFCRNEGLSDRMVRMLVGLVVLGWAMLVQSTAARVVLGIIAALLLITSVAGYCPVYSIFGWDTSKGEPK